MAASRPRLPDVFQLAQGRRGDVVGIARLAGATTLWEWIGEGATVVSY